MSEIFVFLGPTLPVEEARLRLDAAYLPPVSQGDVAGLVDRAPRAIGIIDGIFQLVPTVWHKEILYALDAGIPVFGAASMGALRAAELDHFGMRGVGRIYRWYASGILDADDEVAVTHAPAALGHQPLSEAMVNIRATLGQAVEQGCLSRTDAADLIEICAATPYWLRGRDRLIRDAERAGFGKTSIRHLKRMDWVDQKRLDALELLDALQHPDGLAPSKPAARGENTFESTMKFERMLDQDLPVHQDGDARLTAQALADFVRLAPCEEAALHRSHKLARAGAPAQQIVAALDEEDCLNRTIAAASRADRSDGVRPVEGDDEAAFAAFCARQGRAGQSFEAVAADLGFASASRLLDRLHRFGAGDA
ncbi:MAG: TfuA-like protein [Pseudomonadota bacterium]